MTEPAETELARIDRLDCVTNVAAQALPKLWPIPMSYTRYPELMNSLTVGRAATLLVVFIAACATASAQPVTFSNPDQFLVDKETDFVAIVKVTRVENRWVVLPHGDHLPFVVADCTMEEVLAGAAWPIGGINSTMQFDYNDLMFEPIAPPAIADRRYVLWALRSSTNGEIPLIAPWTAHPQGMLLIRRQGNQEFVFWNGKNYSVAGLRLRLRDNPPLPLDQIVNPARRLSVAEARLESGRLGDEKAFVRGLALNILDPVGQARNIARTPGADWMSEAGTQPHELWYSSLALLRDYGQKEGRQAAAIAVLTPIATTGRRRVRLAAALALVDLGSGAGRDALIGGFNAESGAISSDPPDDMTFPGRYPYDDSSMTACAHALARLGDRRGLKHPNPEVRLAAAQAFWDKPDPELRTTLEGLARELEPQVEKLRISGDLAKPRSRGDETTRYPNAWVRTHRLLARFGSEESLRRMTDAYVQDFSTYPQEQTPVIPMARPTMSSAGPSLAGAIHAADASPAHLLERLRKLVPNDTDWTSPPLTALRASLEPASENPAEQVQKKPTPLDIMKLLGNSDPTKRAEGLAAAGYHQFDDLYERVLDVAAHGAGVERNAAIYGLGFYARDVPDGVLRGLLTDDDSEIRLSGLELATRKNPTRFARESMDVVRFVVKQSRTDQPPITEQRSEMDSLPRLLARLARGPLPAALLDGLADPEPQVRRIVIEALALAGNPDAEQPLKSLAKDPDIMTRAAARKAIGRLGPIDR